LAFVMPTLIESRSACSKTLRGTNGDTCGSKKQ